MNERGKKLQPKLSLDIPFEDALARFARVKPTELNEAITGSKGEKVNADEPRIKKHKKIRPQPPER